MSDMPWIDTYLPGGWTVYQLPMRNPEGPSLTDAIDEFSVCGAKSELAAKLFKSAESRGGKPPKFFFWDFEQMAAGHDVFGLSKLGRLTAEWKGHPAGSLVMVTYEGISEGDLASSQLTYFVASC